MNLSAIHPILPPELIDTVIDSVAEPLHPLDSGGYGGHYIQARWQTLEACSLVCRSWLIRSSRYHTFGWVSLISNRGNRSKEFITILDSPLSTVALFVQYLKLEVALVAHGPWEEEIWQHATLHRLKALSAVEVLDMIWIDFRILGTLGLDPADMFNGFLRVKKL